jgi:hypothetical protein
LIFLHLLLVHAVAAENLALRLYGNHGRLLVDERLDIEAGEVRDFRFRYRHRLWTATLTHEILGGETPLFTVRLTRWEDSETSDVLPPGRLAAPQGHGTSMYGFNWAYGIGECLVVEPGTQIEPEGCDKLHSVARRATRRAVAGRFPVAGVQSYNDAPKP